ncbi:hypothetical protein RSK20926_01707 [Roseobacter sp. SK209-2-6]|nr:hypothetical protein RSK20926_01707 [Roseobacter sp. SK209-2-6]
MASQMLHVLNWVFSWLMAAVLD